MNTNTRIELTDTTRDVMIKMADGNPGAITVLIALFQSAEKTDPDCAFGGLGPLLQLDMLGIYGSEIWMLFKDACDQDVTHTLSVLRANQLGIVSAEDIKLALNRQKKLDLNDILRQVQVELPAFAK